MYVFQPQRHLLEPALNGLPRHPARSVREWRRQLPWPSTQSQCRSGRGRSAQLQCGQQQYGRSSEHQWERRAETSVGHTAAAIRVLSSRHPARRHHVQRRTGHVRNSGCGECGSSTSIANSVQLLACGAQSQGR